MSTKADTDTRSETARVEETGTAPGPRQILAVLVILLVSGGVTAQLVASRRNVVSETPERTVPTVEVTEVTPGDVPVVIRCTGRLEPVARLEIASQLAARVARVADGFHVGARVEAGELLFELETTDAELALARAEAAHASAAAQLQLEEANARTALAEWRLVSDEEPGPLVRREPQLAAARATVESAAVEVERARTDLARTRVVAPFAGRIARRDVDTGQYVAPGSTVGTLIGDDEWEVRLAISGADQAFLGRPGGELAVGELADGEGTDTDARVELVLGDAFASTTIEARLVRVAPQVDERTQTLEAFARIGGEDAARAARYGAGSFVRARVEGRVLEGAIVLPRSALRGNDEVLVMGAASRVFRRPVRVARRDSDSIVVVDGLRAGERVVVSELTVAADGMPVDVLDAEARAERALDDGTLDANGGGAQR